jgi:hypothetical protein
MFVYAHVRQAGDREREAARGERDSTGYVKFDTRADKTVTMRIATSLISVDQAKKNLALEIRRRHARARSRRARRAVGRQARRDRGRGRDADQLTDALLEPLPAVPLSELGAREHGHRGAPGLQHAVQSSTDSPPSDADRDRRARRRRQGLRQQRLLGHVPDRVAAYSLLTPRRRASSSTASSSSTRTAAGSRAGRRRATRTS